MAPKPFARDALEAYGIDNICDEITNGSTLTAIAKNVGVSIGSLVAWFAADAERSARERGARALTSRIWDEKAERGIQDAADPFALAKAREAAHHYRWRSSKIDPRYGDKLDLNHSGSIARPVSEHTDAELEEILRREGK